MNNLEQPRGEWKSGCVGGGRIPRRQLDSFCLQTHDSPGRKRGAGRQLQDLNVAAAFGHHDQRKLGEKTLPWLPGVSIKSGGERAGKVLCSAGRPSPGSPCPQASWAANMFF